VQNAQKHNESDLSVLQSSKVVKTTVATHHRSVSELTICAVSNRFVVIVLQNMGNAKLVIAGKYRFIRN
jgi:hypothetical protein